MQHFYTNDQEHQHKRHCKIEAHGMIGGIAHLFPLSVQVINFVLIFTKSKVTYFSFLKHSHILFI